MTRWLRGDFCEIKGLPLHTLPSVATAQGPDSVFRGKTVIVGAVAPSLQDVHPTSTTGDELMSGPEIQANAVWTAEHGFGMHHIGVEVPSLEGALSDMASAGHVPIQTGRGYGLDGDAGYAYFDTLDELGYLLEAIERPARRRPPIGVFE